MKYCEVRLNQYELSTLKSLVKAEYNREQIRFENRYTDDFDKDIIKDSMIRLLTIGGKLNNVITRADKITDDVSILGKRKYKLFGEEIK